MESLQNIKRRIKGISNIGQITKAMELVAATKMRKSQEVALESRPYVYAALEILATLSKLENVTMPALMQPRDIQKTLVVVITSDKGLAGSFNSAILRAFEKFMKQNTSSPLGGGQGGGLEISSNAKSPSAPAGHLPLKGEEGRFSFLAIGQRAKQYLDRRDISLAGSFVRTGDFTKREESDPVANFLIDGYLSGEWDEVVIFSTMFVTALRQDVMQRQLLPVNFENLKETAEELIPRAGRYSHYIDPEVFGLEEKEDPSGSHKNANHLPSARGEDYIIEPSPGEVLEKLAPELLKIRLYDWLMESNASEHSARRMAMKSASDNANELSENLSVEYNKSRQAAITAQIIEITSGAQST